jgi:hypothetical protein
MPLAANRRFHRRTVESSRADVIELTSTIWNGICSNSLAARATTRACSFVSVLLSISRG